MTNELNLEKGKSNAQNQLTNELQQGERAKFLNCSLILSQTITEKKQVDEELKITKQSLTAGQSENAQAVIELNNLRTRLETLESKSSIQEDHLRTKRRVGDTILGDLKNICKTINENLKTTIENLNFEFGRTSGTSRSKRKVSSAHWMAGAGLAWNAWNYGKSENQKKNAVEHLVKRSYEEFLRFVQTQSKFNSESSQMIRSNNVNLERLNVVARENSESWATLAAHFNQLQDFSQTNRVIVAMHHDLNTIQRLIVAATMQNTVKTRILESQAILRNGYLPSDFVNTSELKKIIREVGQGLAPDLRLAFGEEDVLNYYDLPIASVSTRGNQPIITIRLLVVRIDRKHFEFDMHKLQGYPFRCWSSKMCSVNDTYRVQLNDDIVFTKRGKVERTYLRKSLECMKHFDSRMCWIADEEISNRVDPCLSEILNNRTLTSCAFLTTSEKVEPIKAGHMLYESRMINSTLIVSRNATWTSESELNANLQQNLPRVKACFGEL